MNKRIRLLKSGFGNDKGDVITVEEETDLELYYTDGFDRWCYMYKSEEGDSFEYYYGDEPSFNEYEED